MFCLVLNMNYIDIVGHKKLIFFFLLPHFTRLCCLNVDHLFRITTKWKRKLKKCASWWNVFIVIEFIVVVWRKMRLKIYKNMLRRILKLSKESQWCFNGDLLWCLIFYLVFWCLDWNLNTWLYLFMFLFAAFPNSIC